MYVVSYQPLAPYFPCPTPSINSIIEYSSLPSFSLSTQAILNYPIPLHHIIIKANNYRQQPLLKSYDIFFEYLKLS